MPTSLERVYFGLTTLEGDGEEIQLNTSPGQTVVQGVGLPGPPSPPSTQFVVAESIADAIAIIEEL